MSGARKKLIEVALPLEAINRESAREKSIRHGHPSTLHIWWARRPLAACRAVLFASIVDDPSSRPEEFPVEEDQERERQRLFRIIEELVKWENSNNETVLEAARAEIRKATGGNPPPVLDPFCGGGSIPLEAQRLGLEAYASDLNPVAVLITKALVEIPPKFAGRPPVNPESREKLAYGGTWRGAKGLAEDVRYYGKWMRDQAFKRIGHLYPNAKLPEGGEATVIAWLWARTVRCPNPACGAQMTLARSFALSTKRGKEALVEPVIDRESKAIRFEIRHGPGSSQGTVDRRGAKCLVCRTVVPLEYIRGEAQAGNMQLAPLAVIAEAERGRIYLAPSREYEVTAASAEPEWGPEELVTTPSHDVDRLPMYGMRRWRDAFTPRQLVALTTFSDLVIAAREYVLADGGSESYADAVATYLAFGVDRSANYWSSLTPWGGDFIVQTFGRQAIPMVWDFAEANPFSESTGNWSGAIEWIAKCLEVAAPARGRGMAKQLDARAIAVDGASESLTFTDPPYYDNVGYADLSDFFYVWLRRSIGKLYPDLFSTLLTPKAQELVASPHRFDGDARRAERFFEEGLRTAFVRLRQLQNPYYPLSLFYAFKQAEARSDGAVSSTGWETMLTGLLDSGLAISGTWPIRSERDQGLKTGTNVLASSIVLVCRPRSTDASLATRRDFVAALKAELPEALRKLQHGNIAPVDLAQAAIGPGMAIFSRYAKVVEADGSPMTVRTALGLINQVLDEILAEQEGDFDADTRFAVTWFEQHGTSEGLYGEADVLARAKNTAVRGMEEAEVLHSRGGKVRLLNREELSDEWDPAVDKRITVWEVAQHLIKRLEEGGEEAAADLLRRVGGLGETARQLAYRLYTTCERKGWAQEALSYNGLVVAWPEIARRVAGTPEAQAQQALEV